MQVFLRFAKNYSWFIQGFSQIAISLSFILRITRMKLSIKDPIIVGEDSNI